MIVWYSAQGESTGMIAIMIRFGEGGTIAAGSMIISVTLERIGPPAITVMHPGGPVVPGPCGVAAGVALTIGQVCISVTRHAGLLPIRTVGKPTPMIGGPCIMGETIVAEGKGMGYLG